MLDTKTGFKMSALILSLTLFLTACGSGSGGSGSGSGSGSKSASGDTSKPADTAAVGNNKIVARFGHGSAQANARHVSALRFKELVEKKSNGQIEIQVFPGEQLGSEPAMLQSVQSNLIQMTAAGAGIYTKNHKDIGIVELPYLFDNFEQAWKVLDGPFGKQLSEPLVSQGIRVLAYWENGFRHITNNTRPITKPADLKGIKIRTPEIPVTISIFKNLGANPTPLNFGELFQALEQKIVDGQENPLTNIYNSKFFEVQKYLSLTNHQYSPLPFSISEKFWQTLNPEQQKIIEESAKEAGQYHRQLVKADDEKLVAEMEKKGMKVNQPEMQPFKDAVKPVYEEFTKVYGKELMDKLNKAISEAK